MTMQMTQLTGARTPTFTVAKVNRARGQLAGVSTLNAPFSLTPALSRWEREKVSPRSTCCGVPVSRTRTACFPLPAGEGRGEGAGLVLTKTRHDLTRHRAPDAGVRAPFALVALLLSLLALPSRAADADLAALTKGVKEIAGPGAPGNISVFGPAAFAVVAGKEGKTAASPVVAAAHAGKGRVVAFGHTSFLDADILTQLDTGKFMDNAIAWAGGAAKPTLVVPKSKSLADALTKRGFTVAPTPLAQLQPGQVLIYSAHSLAAADLPLIAKFITDGGGLITASTGWGWVQISGGRSLANEFLGNKLLAPLGLVFGGNMASKTTAKGFAVEPTSPLAHAGKALDAARAGTKLAKDDLAQASAALTLAAQSLPADDKTFLPKLKALRAQPGVNTTPTAKSPVKSDQLAARVLVSLDGRELETLPPAQLKAHPSAASFPGPVPADAKRETATVSVNPKIPGWHSTGLYAAPGEVVTVRVPASSANAGWKIRIGAHSDRLWHLDSWKRFPDVSRSYAVKAAETQVASAFGGQLFVETPKASDGAEVKVEFAGAVRAPHYIHGKTTLAEWKELRTAPAPWGELETKKIVLSLPSSVLRNLEDPIALMKVWDETLDLVADLAAIPKERPRAERIVCDEQISAGYMHSGYPIMTWLDMPPRLVSEAHMRKGDWGIGHELGHNHQVGDWTFEGTGEVTCNLFTMYVIDRIGGTKPANGRVGLPVVAEKFAKYTAGGKPDFAKWQSDPFLALAMYVQLQHAFGWEAYKRVFAEYRTLPASEKPKGTTDRIDQWMVHFSKTVNRNLGPFFQAWGLPVTDPALASIAKLPAWPKEEWPGTNGKMD